LRVQAWDRFGNEIDEEVRVLKAFTYQHEVDHLDGLLFLDKVLDVATLATWDSFNEFHKEAFVGRVTALVAKHGS
jgi:peptide deformylase